MSNISQCVLIQGPSCYVSEVKKAYDGACDLIFSIWSGEEALYDKSDTIISSQKPECPGVGNLFNHYTSTINGLRFVKKLGYERVIKMRSDMVPTNPRKFLSLFDKDLNLFYWHNHDGGYIVDYFMGGKIDSVIDLWSIDLFREYRFSEQAITHSFFSNGLNFKDYQYIGRGINAENDIRWLKYNKTLAHYSNDPLYVTTKL